MNTIIEVEGKLLEFTSSPMREAVKDAATAFAVVLITGGVAVVVYVATQVFLELAGLLVLFVLVSGLSRKPGKL